MANQEQVDLIKQGVEQWNQWRWRHRDILPDLSGTHLRRANLREAHLSDVDLSGADLSEAHLNDANLSDANLSDTDLWRADLRCAHLSGAHVNGAHLNDADLRGADLWRADLSNADLSNANLIRANFKQANWTRATIGWTICGDMDLRSVIGLETVRHSGPSTIGLDTIYWSHGQIPEAFLRGAGVPETFLTNMRALVESMSPIEFYSCFLSYSSANEDFAKRLYADLHREGVRCWFAPIDMKIGDKIRSRIDEAIHLQDKLLLLLSEHSIQSSWVEDEVEAALEKEQRQQREVLFPVRLDGSVMQTSQAWAAKLRRTRHIGDFTHWTDPQAYQRAFERLLRDLKAEN